MSVHGYGWRGLDQNNPAGGLTRDGREPSVLGLKPYTHSISHAIKGDLIQPGH